MMYTYRIKRMPNPYAAMSIDRRNGLVPEQGYCSIKPAQHFQDALPAAAAGKQAYIFGNPLQEKIVIRHEALQIPVTQVIPTPPEIADILPEVRKLLIEGKGYEAAALSVDTAKARGYGGYIHFLNNNPRDIELPLSAYHTVDALKMELDFCEDGEIFDYLRTLDFALSEASVYWTDDRGCFVRKSFMSEPDDVFVQHITPADKCDTVRLHLRIAAPDSWNSLGMKTNCIHTQNAMIYAAEYAVREGGHYAVTYFNAFGGTVLTEADGRVCITDAPEILIFTRIVPLEVFDSTVGEEILHALTLLPQRYSVLLSRHRKAHGDRISRCMLRFDCGRDCLSVEELFENQYCVKTPLQPKLLEIMFDSGRYFLATNTGKYPPLWGQWNINVNLQVCSGNMTSLPEMMDVFFRFVEDKLPDYRTNAKNIFGCRGILADIHPDLTNGLLYHFTRTYPHHYWTACAGWIYNEFYARYLITGDEVFLKEHVLPGLRETALFYIDFLKDRDPDGNYIFYPCWSPENEPLGQSPVTVNAVMDIMVCREVMENLLQAEAILGIDDALKENYEDILSHLPTLLIDDEGGLKEWAWAGHPERFNHRHVSHHYDVWPGMKVRTNDNPELAEAILKSNRKRGQQDDSAHGIMHRLFTAIRLNQVDDTVFFLQQLFRHGFINENMTTNHFPYRMEFPDMLGGIPAALAEMVIGSRPGEITFFPALPNCLSKGTLHGVKLYTFAALERLEWNFEQNDIQARICSLKNQICRFRIGMEGQYQILMNGLELTLDEIQNGVVLEIDKVSDIVIKKV